MYVYDVGLNNSGNVLVHLIRDAIWIFEMKVMTSKQFCFLSARTIAYIFKNEWLQKVLNHDYTFILAAAASLNILRQATWRATKRHDVIVDAWSQVTS